jgi:hypothetical protein
MARARPRKSATRCAKPEAGNQTAVDVVSQVLHAMKGAAVLHIRLQKTGRYHIHADDQVAVRGTMQRGAGGLTTVAQLLREACIQVRFKDNNPMVLLVDIARSGFERDILRARMDVKESGGEMDVQVNPSGAYTISWEGTSGKYRECQGVVCDAEVMKFVKQLREDGLTLNIFKEEL